MKFQKCRQLGIYYKAFYTVTDNFLDQNFTEIPLRHDRNNNRTAYFEIGTKILMIYQIVHTTWACSIKLLTLQLITRHSKWYKICKRKKSDSFLIQTLRLRKFAVNDKKTY
jgi:hypothetical protein